MVKVATLEKADADAFAELDGALIIAPAENDPRRACLVDGSNEFLAFVGADIAENFRIPLNFLE
ncbi:MAG TPA: hypothetical protein DCO73_06725, partial [Alphaproteobacteria bacterium]|nr:hypothetical protein [Alphaproteobacteria bacterium]